jgi:ribosomal protein S18 acetylase RimI-like enzyme
MIKSVEISGIKYGICEKSDLDEMANLLAETFCRFDPPAVAVGITPNDFEKFVRLLFPGVLKDELTIIARSSETGKMAGALLTEDAAAPLPDELEYLDKFTPIFEILGELDTEYWKDKERIPGNYLHLFLLGVSPAFAGKGIAQQLVRECLKNGTSKGYKFAVTEATNNISQHIFKQHNFNERVKRSYRNFVYRNKKVFESIDGHAGPVLMDKDLLL